jgi:hypothetical protein
VARAICVPNPGGFGIISCGEGTREAACSNNRSLAWNKQTDNYGRINAVNGTAIALSLPYSRNVRPRRPQDSEPDAVGVRLYRPIERTVRASLTNPATGKIVSRVVVWVSGARPRARRVPRTCLGLNKNLTRPVHVLDRLCCLFAACPRQSQKTRARNVYRILIHINFRWGWACNDLSKYPRHSDGAAKADLERACHISSRLPVAGSRRFGRRAAATSAP